MAIIHAACDVPSDVANYEALLCVQCQGALNGRDLAGRVFLPPSPYLGECFGVSEVSVAEAFEDRVPFGVRASVLSRRPAPARIAYFDLLDRPRLVEIRDSVRLRSIRYVST
jgi:hypothetical protein